MMTEELAREFSELCGWEHKDMDGRLFFAPKAPTPSVRGNLHPFPDGWAGVGIVEAECYRQGIRFHIKRNADGSFSAATFHGREGMEAARAPQPLDAVLAAAIAALRAEGGE